MRPLYKLREFTQLLFFFLLFVAAVTFFGMTASYINSPDHRNSEGEVLATFQTSVQVLGNCGNNIQEPPEECDGTDLDGYSCSSLGYDGGTLSCNTNCTRNTSSCFNNVPTCGNNVKEAGEECDGADLGGASCSTFGFNNGSLSCNSNCTYNKGACFTIIPTSVPTLPPNVTPTITPTPDPNELTDTDGDGLSDAWELSYAQCHNYLVPDNLEDYDSDDILSRDEYVLDSNPCVADTDGDGMPDGWELLYDLDLLNDDSDQDPDNDGRNNIQEFFEGTNPRVAEIDPDVVISITPETGGEEEAGEYPWEIIIPSVFCCSVLIGGLAWFFLAGKKKNGDDKATKIITETFASGL